MFLSARPRVSNPPYLPCTYLFIGQPANVATARSTGSITLQSSEMLLRYISQASTVTERLGVGLYLSRAEYIRAMLYKAYLLVKTERLLNSLRA